MARIADLLATCPVVHADETSMRVGVAAWWVHMVSSSGLTNLALHPRRGIAARYDEIVAQALALLPGDAPPPRRHRGGWTNTERDAWNLATQLRDGRDQVLALLDDWRIPFTNNDGERSLRMARLHDKISGHSRNADRGRAFLTVRSYLQAGAKQGQRAMDLLMRLWTPEGAWLPSVADPAPG